MSSPASNRLYTGPGSPRRLQAFPPTTLPNTEQILDSIHDGVLVTEIATGRVVHANAAACRMFNHTLPALKETTIAALSDGAPPYSNAEAACWAERAATLGPQVFEWRARTAEGRRFWVEVALRADQEMCPGLCIATVRDSTTRKEMAAERERAHAALRQSEERFRLLIGRMPNLAVCGCGPDGTVRYWNEASDQLYGYTAAETLGRSLVQLIVPPAQHDEALVSFHQMMACGRAFPPAEIQVRHKDGSIIPVFSSQLVVTLPGDGPELFRLDFDLRDRKRAEAERLELERHLLQNQKLESLGVLAGGIAHDFNNLLTGVLGNIELAQTEVPSGSQIQPLLHDAVAAARLAANLTHQMLAYTGRTRFQLQPIDVNRTIREHEPLLHAAAAQRATLQFALSPNLSEIEADPAQVGQIVVNLVTNAAESIVHTPGTVEIRTREVFCDSAELEASWCSEKPLPQRFVSIEIADTGAGMDEATVQRVFDPFFSTKFAGRGLGLPVALGIVKAHHGALFVESSPGRGSTLRILLPMARPPSINASDFNVTPPLAPPHPAGSLLVVDDEPHVRQIAGRMAERLGHPVLVAENGEQAIEVCRQHHDEIIGAIIDLTMPGMSGLECLNLLHEVAPGLPAVLASGYPKEEIPGTFCTSSFCAFLQKPFTFEGFAKAVRLLSAR